MAPARMCVYIRAMLSPLPPVQLRLLLLGGLRLRDWSRAVAERPCWRAYWHPAPGSWLEHAGRRHPLDAAQVVLVPPRTPVQRGLDRPIPCLFWHFSAGEPWDALAGRLYAVAAERLGMASLQGLLDALLAGAAPEELAGLELQRLTLSALAALPAADLPPGTADAGVRRMLTAVRRDPARRWSVPELARIAGCPQRTCIRRCRAATGRSPHALVLALRLERAALLLQEGGPGIEAIAATCGFVDRHHLTRRFSARFGCGPAAFRRRHG